MQALSTYIHIISRNGFIRHLTTLRGGGQKSVQEIAWLSKAVEKLSKDTHPIRWTSDQAKDSQLSLNIFGRRRES